MGHHALGDVTCIFKFQIKSFITEYHQNKKMITDNLIICQSVTVWDPEQNPGGYHMTVALYLTGFAC